MSGSARRRRTLTIAAMCSLAASSVAITALVFVAGPAAASGSPADHYSVINGTANAATDHEILGSSAFPNFVTGAVDNYYSMAHSYVDNSPFAEGTSSPADTGPIGQTVAAGNFSQPQYADARWPGKDSGKATFGSQGGPYAVSTASSFKATADSSEASSGSSGSTAIAGPKGFGRRLRRVLRAWKAKWLPRLRVQIPAPVTVPSTTTPTATTPSVTTPTTTAPSLTTPTLTTPTLTTPTVSTPTVTAPTLTTASASSGQTSSSRTLASSSGNAGSLLESSTLATLQSDGSLVTSGESSLGRVTLGGGQIAIAGIDVSASITSKGAPTAKASVHVGAGSIGGVPVTIDQDGVHVDGQGQGLPYRQADDALNAALKQAGIQLFTVAPEITQSPNQETVTATGVHVKFTQVVNQSGVPSQYAEHILGEVYVDSLAVPGVPFGSFDFNFNGGFGSGSGGGMGLGGGSTMSGGGTGLGSSGGSSTTGGSTGGATGGGSTGLLTGGGSASPGSVSGYTTAGSSSQPSSGSGGGSQQAAGQSILASARSKPLWLLVSYFLWQALVIGTGVGLRRWGLGGAS